MSASAPQPKATTVESTGATPLAKRTAPQFPTMSPERFQQIIDKNIENSLAILVDKFKFSAVVNSGNNHATIKFGEIGPELESRMLQNCIAYRC